MKIFSKTPPVDKRYRTIPVIKYFLLLVFKHSKTYCFVSILDIIFSSITPFINVIFPKMILDELFGERDIKKLIIYVAIIAGGNAAMRFIQSSINTVKNRKVDRLNKIFDKLIGIKYMSMDFQYTEDPEALTQADKASTGMSWYSGGINGLVNHIIQIISSIIKLIGVIYILATFSPLIILLITIIIIVNMFINAKLISMNAKFRKELVGINRKSSYYFGLNMDFTYGKDLRIFNADGLITQRTKRYNDLYWLSEAKMKKKERIYSSLMHVITLIQIAVLHLYLAARIIAGHIIFSDYVMLVSATEVFSQSLDAIITHIIQIRNAGSFMSEYKKFMDYPDVTNKDGNKIPIWNNEHTIQFNNVSFKYPNRSELILDNINLTITPNQKLSIVGLNGAGKTTFIKLLCRLYDPTEGNITFDGIDIREYDYEEYMKLFSVVFQDFKTFSFTIRENLAFGTSDETKNNDDKQILIIKIDESLKKAGLEERIKSLEHGIDTAVYKNFDKDGMEFSGGEMQKLAIARAIFKDAPIVILDEPTAALDPVAEYEIYSRFDNLIGEKTSIYISHRLSSCRFCDVIAVFHEGKVTEYGSHDELVKLDGLYSEMWNSQAQYYIENKEHSSLI